jgi:hypothetical protein
MSFSKIALLASVAAFLASGTHYAQAQMVDEGHVIHVDPSGKTKVMRVHTKGHEALMKEGRPLAAGAIIYRSGGRLHLVEDKRMPGGKMLSEDNEYFQLQQGEK